MPLALPDLLEVDGAALLREHAVPLLGTALGLAAISALESGLNTRAIDHLLQTRHDPDRELAVLGGASMLCGLLGGLPLVATRTRSLATLRAGGRGRRPALAGSLILLALFLFGGPLLAQLPLAVLGGLMLVVASGLADRWSGQMLLRWWAGPRSR